MDQALYQKLLETGFQRGQKPVRLLGVGIRLSSDEEANQLALFDAETTLLSEAPDHQNDD
jgi:DNA polymerase-4